MALHSAWVWDNAGRVEGPGRDRRAQVLGRAGAPRRDRPRHPGARRARAGRWTSRSPSSYVMARQIRIADGADEVHKSFVANKRAKAYKPVDGLAQRAHPLPQGRAPRALRRVPRQRSGELLMRMAPSRRTRSRSTRRSRPRSSGRGSPSTCPAPSGTVEVTQIAGGSSNLTFRRARRRARLGAAATAAAPRPRHRARHGPRAPRAVRAAGHRRARSPGRSRSATTSR